MAQDDRKSGPLTLYGPTTFFLSYKLGLWVLMTVEAGRADR